MNDTDDKTTYALKDLLFKLGVKTAEIDPFEKVLGNTIRNLQNQFGTPNQMMMSPSSFDAFAKTFGNKK